MEMEKVKVDGYYAPFVQQKHILNATYYSRAPIIRLNEPWLGRITEKARWSGTFKFVNVDRDRIGHLNRWKGISEFIF